MGYCVDTLKFDIKFDLTDDDETAKAIEYLIKTVPPHGGSYRPGEGKVDAWWSWACRPSEAATWLKELGPAEALLKILHSFRIIDVYRGYNPDESKEDRERLDWEAIMEKYPTPRDELDVSGWPDFDKLGQELELLEALAGIIKDGSVVQMRGEDGAHFGLEFSNGEARELTGSVCWD